MKFGVVGFRYGDATFQPFRDQLKVDGYYTVNLGDNAQTIAAKKLYRKLGAVESDIVTIYREEISSYSGEPVLLIMNAVFYHGSFPVSPDIIPVFVGFTVGDEKILEENRQYLERYQPIGCRDTATSEKLRNLGVEAFTTGCITLTLEDMWESPLRKKFLVAYGGGAGELPTEVLKFVPHELLDAAEFLFHRYPIHEHPLSAARAAIVEQYEERLLERYRREVSLVLTPLHHVASPCLAMGVPVVVCRRVIDNRFDYLSKFIPIYLPNSFPEIDWTPIPPDMRNVREILVRSLQKKLDLLAGIKFNPPPVVEIF